MILWLSIIWTGLFRFARKIMKRTKDVKESSIQIGVSQVELKLK
jgi:hypothetical protein